MSRNPFDSNLLAEILSSSLRRNSSKYISLILMHNDLWNDDMLLTSKNDRNETMMHHVIKSGKLENLFSFLMPDWFNHESRFERNYALVTKSQQFEQETGEKFLGTIYEMIADEKNRIYQDVLLRLLYQYLTEVVKQHQSNFNSEFLSISKILEMRNFEYKTKILQVLVVYLETYDEHFKSSVMSCCKRVESEIFFVLAFALREKHMKEFREKLEYFVDSVKKTYGDYFQIVIKPQIQLLFEITKRHNMIKTGDFIIQKFPFIDKNSTIMTSFYTVQDLDVFNISPFRNKTLDKQVKTIFNTL